MVRSTIFSKFADMKSDEKTISALTAQAHNAEADKRTLQKKLAASERRVQDLENRLAEQQSSSDERIRSLTDQLSQEMAKVSSMMQQLVDFMMGKGAVSLSDTLRESVVAGIREEVRKEMRQEYQGIIDEKDARISALEAMQNHGDNGDGTESPETTIKKLEQRNKDLNRDLHGQKTEGKYNGRKKGQKVSWIIYEHLVKHVTLSEIENDLKSLGLNIAHSTLCHWMELAADKLEPLDEPLHQEIITSGNFHSDESTLQLLDVPVGTKEGEEVPMHYYVRWIYDFIAPGSGLTQYWFYDQGRRTQEAVEEYVKGITEKTYIHTDGAKMYEIYNAAGIIMRVACAVHVRRPFWKLKDASDDAARLVYLFDEVFRKERKWNGEDGMTAEERRRRRWEEVYPILHEMKNILDRMEKELDKETEPDLVRAVSFAQKEYPQLLRYLDDGKLAFSNNICELQMRQIAIYRNNSYFLGSVKSAKRFARLVSLTQSAKNCKRNVQKYFHDILNRVVVTVKDELVNILPHKWDEPVTIPLVY